MNTVSLTPPTETEGFGGDPGTRPVTADPPPAPTPSTRPPPSASPAPRGGSDTADFVDIVTFDAWPRPSPTTSPRAAGSPHPTETEVSAGPRETCLRHSTWTTTEGEKRSKVGVVADGIIFLDSPKAKANGNGPDPANRPGEEPDWPGRRNRSRRSA